VVAYIAAQQIYTSAAERSRGQAKDKQTFTWRIKSRQVDYLWEIAIVEENSKYRQDYDRSNKKEDSWLVLLQYSSVTSVLALLNTLVTEGGAVLW
jgi:hypothetical protein